MSIKKRGISNLETILSFLIFIGFIFFLFLFFPITRSEKSSVGLDAAERGIMNFTSSELVYFTVSFNETKISLGCFHFHPNLTLEKVIVKDESDNLISASSAGTEDDFAVYINGTGKFYQVYSSSVIEERDFIHTECGELGPADFDFSLIRKYNVLSYNKISALNSSYFSGSGYSELHSRFNIPKREDFGFIVRETTGREIFNAIKGNGDRADVLSRDIPVQILYSNGTLNYDILNIRTW